MGIIMCPGGRAVLHARIWDGATPPVTHTPSSPAWFSPGRPKQSHTLLWVPRFKKDEVRDNPEQRDGMGVPGNTG